MPLMNLTGRFGALDDNLKLDPKVRAEVESVHNQLGDLLVKAGVAKRTRLQGSLARHTMRGPELHDVDKVVELVDDLRDSLAGPGGAEKAMRLISNALAPHLPGAQFEIKKHALGISLQGNTFDFDAVPAFNPDDGTGWIVIADTEDDAWEPSNTYILIDTIAARNQACDGRFVRQVRMVKQAVHEAGLDDVLPGLRVETFAYEAITTSMDHADAVAATLSMGTQLLGGSYTDPTGVDRISDRLDPEDVAKASAGMQRLADLAGEAQQLAAVGNETGAAHIWADIFGAPFPRPTADEKAFLHRLHLGASVAAATRQTPTTRAWSPA
jgi:hypothetical protein